MWSFNPETNILLNVPLHGTILTRPLLESELVIGAVILRGHLRIAGHHLGRCDIKDLPKEITVATSRTLSYYKLGASQRVAGDSGFAAYSRYRIGNYKLNTDHSSSSDNIALLVQYQVTIAEILLIIMRTFKVSIWNLDYIINLIIKNLSKSLTENKYSQLDEEQPMEID